MKKNIVIVVLVVLVLGLSGYLVYDKVLNKEEVKNESHENNNIDEDTIKEDKLSYEEIKKYLSYVPIGVGEKDAYSEKQVDINTVAKDAVLRTVLYNSDLKVTSCDKVAECYNERNILKEDFNNKLFEMYNIKIDQFKSEYDNKFKGYLYEDSLIALKDGYYFELGHGNGKDKSATNKVSYELNGTDLIIKEQIALISSSECTFSIMDGSEVIKTYECGDAGYDEASADKEQYIKDNFSDFNTYKHTFKLNDSGKYYWYSTEVVD